MTYSVPDFESVYCFIPGSNSCFLSCISGDRQGDLVFATLKNFPQFVVIHTVKGFCIADEAEVDVFWNSIAFFMIQQTLAICCLSYVNLLFFFFTT